MKADLDIGGEACVPVEFVAPPRRGDKVLINGTEYEISRIGHDCDKRKLHVTCQEARYVADTWAEATGDGEDSMIETEIDILDDDLAGPSV